MAETWRPIDTAPKDGTLVLLWSEFWAETFGIVIARWQSRAGWVCAEFITGDWEEEDQPTHWHPVPDPPHGADQ